MSLRSIDITQTCGTREDALRWLISTKGKDNVYLIVNKSAKTEWLFYDRASTCCIIFYRGFVCVHDSQFNCDIQRDYFVFRQPWNLAEFYAENAIHHSYTREEAFDMWWIFHWFLPSSQTKETVVVATMSPEEELVRNLLKRVGKNVGDRTTNACLDSLRRIVFDHIGDHGAISPRLNGILEKYGLFGCSGAFYCQDFMRDLERRNAFMYSRTSLRKKQNIIQRATKYFVDMEDSDDEVGEEIEMRNLKNRSDGQWGLWV